MNEQHTRLCFYRESKSDKAIMISDKSANGEWSEPYPDVRFVAK